jgi:hypothetical protein
MRVPLMHGLPIITAESVVMRVCAMRFVICSSRSPANISREIRYDKAAPLRVLLS